MDATIAQWIHLRLSTGSSPKYTIYAFITYSKICAMFVIRKERKLRKRGRVFGPFKKYVLRPDTNSEDVVSYRLKSNPYPSLCWST